MDGAITFARESVMTGAARTTSRRRLSVLLAMAGLCVGCANHSLESEADELRTEISGLPGVTSAHLDYSKPIPLNSGQLALDVEMGSAATSDQVIAVTEIAYDAFRETHRGEEAGLSIHTGQTTIALRSFEPEASVSAVDSAVRAGLLAAPALGSVAIDLTTDGVPGGDHVAGTYMVSLREGSTYTDVPDLLASLAVDNPDSSQIGWGGRAFDGASLSYDSGFPPAELIDRWERLQSVALPLSVRALDSGALFLEGRLADRVDVDAPADRHRLDTMTHPQLRTLGDGQWVYTLRGPGGGYLAEVDRYLCLSVSEGPYDDDLEAWAAARFGPCEDD